MKGDDRVISFLNEHLTAELTLLNQYFLNYKMLENWALGGLAKVFKDLSFEEMSDAEHLIERILFLEGHPNLQRLGNLQIGQDPIEQLRIALDAEYEAISRLRQGVELAVDAGDHGTREMLAEMLHEEEGHADFLESQLDVVERIGPQNYLSNFVTKSS